MSPIEKEDLGALIERKSKDIVLRWMASIVIALIGVIGYFVKQDVNTFKENQQYQMMSLDYLIRASVVDSMRHKEQSDMLQNHEFRISHLENKK